MNRSLSWLYARAPRPALYAALVCLAAGFVIVFVNSWSVSFSGKGDAYCAGEWLINYGGGFVRRGLGGSVILWLAHALATSPRLLLCVLLVACYAIIFVTLAMILLRLPEAHILDLLLAVSPFAALFPALHPVAGERKEVLLLALAGLAYVSPLGRLDDVAKYAFWSVTLGILVAVHDGLIFFVPLFVLYLRTLTPARIPIGFRAAVLVIPAAVIFILGYLYAGHANVQAICSTLSRQAAGNWCAATPGTAFPYAASWLKASALDGVHSVLGRYTAASGSLVLLTGAAGLLPIAVALANDCGGTLSSRDPLLSLPFFAVCALSVVPLFAVASDWNRWFYITTSVLTLIHFSLRTQSGNAP